MDGARDNWGAEIASALRDLFILIVSVLMGRIKLARCHLVLSDLVDSRIRSREAIEREEKEGLTPNSMDGASGMSPIDWDRRIPDCFEDLAKVDTASLA